MFKKLKTKPQIRIKTLDIVDLQKRNPSKFPMNTNPLISPLHVARKKQNSKMAMIIKNAISIKKTTVFEKENLILKIRKQSENRQNPIPNTMLITNVVI